MADPAFLAMRVDLVERGLLTAEHRLTPAGHAHVEQLIGELRGAEAPGESEVVRVFWSHSFRQRRRAHA